jgi:hypothetical protein
VRHLGNVLFNIDLFPTRPSRGIGQELRVTAAVEGDKEERRLIDRVAAGDDAMVAENDATVLGAQRLGDPPPFLGRHHGAAVGVVDAQVVVEADCVLVQRLNDATCRVGELSVLSDCR